MIALKDPKPKQNPINLFVFCLRTPKYYVEIITRYHKFTSIMRFNFGLVFDIFACIWKLFCVRVCVSAGACAGMPGLNQFNFMVYNIVEFTHLPINYMSCVEKQKRLNGITVPVCGTQIYFYNSHSPALHLSKSQTFTTLLIWII